MEQEKIPLSEAVNNVINAPSWVWFRGYSKPGQVIGSLLGQVRIFPVEEGYTERVKALLDEPIFQKACEGDPHKLLSSLKEMANYQLPAEECTPFLSMLLGHKTFQSAYEKEYFKGRDCITGVVEGTYSESCLDSMKVLLESRTFLPLHRKLSHRALEPVFILLGGVPEAEYMQAVQVFLSSGVFQRLRDEEPEVAFGCTRGIMLRYAPDAKKEEAERTIRGMPFYAPLALDYVRSLRGEHNKVTALTVKEVFGEKAGDEVAETGFAAQELVITPTRPAACYPILVFNVLAQETDAVTTVASMGPNAHMSIEGLEKSIQAERAVYGLDVSEPHKSGLRIAKLFRDKATGELPTLAEALASPEGLKKATTAYQTLAARAA